MATIKMYYYSKCSTCTKALKFVEKKGLKPNLIDITEVPPSKTELQQMLKIYDGDIKRLFNTSGVQYRELKIKDQLPTLSQTKVIDLLSKNGRLVKRPFILIGNKGAIGFKEDEWKTLLK